MSSRNQLPTSSSQVTSGSTSTPNSSISNMACLPELDQDSNNSKRSPQETPSPPPAPNPPMTTTTTAIYARVNPNLKRDKTNNNNFSSTFAPIHSTTDQKIGPAAVNPSMTNVPQYHSQRTSSMALNSG